jgi:transcriptional regulator of arginine metabolism
LPDGSDHSIIPPVNTPRSGAERRAAIRALLEERPAYSQGELLALLGERGFPCSQPVLSRDLRALGVAKRSGAYELVEEERVTPLASLRSLLRGTEPVSELVLVRCEPGAASAVARALEAEEIPGVAGTLAGDDTVLVALHEESAGAEVCRRVRGLLPD